MRALDVLLLTLSSIAAAFIIYPPIPRDDLLRHLTSYKHNYDLRSLYFDSYWPSFNPYIGFDYLAGLMHFLFGDLSLSLIPFIVVTLASVSFFFYTRNFSDDIVRALSLIAFFYLVLPYIIGARPKCLMISLFLLSVSTRSTLLSLIPGFISIPLYHAFWVYTLPLLIKSRYFILPLVCGITFWWVYGGFEYFYFEKALLTIKDLRGEISISENKPLWSALFPLFPLITLIFYRFKDKPSNLLYIIYFSIPNQVRFLELLIPLILNYASRITLPSMRRSLVLFLFPLVFIPYASTVQSEHVRDFYLLKDIPVSGRVFCGTMECSFFLAYHRDDIKLNPPPEVGFMSEKGKKLLTLLLKGEVDCWYLKGIDYLIEKSLTKNAKCLTLVSIRGSYRVWRVSFQEPSE